MPIALKSLLSRGAAAAPVLGTLAVIATVSFHLSPPSVHAVGRSAVTVSDAARATVVGIAHHADASVIVFTEYMIDVSSAGTPLAA